MIFLLGMKKQTGYQNLRSSSTVNDRDDNQVLDDTDNDNDGFSDRRRSLVDDDKNEIHDRNVEDRNESKSKGKSLGGWRRPLGVDRKRGELVPTVDCFEDGNKDYDNMHNDGLVSNNKPKRKELSSSRTNSNKSLNSIKPNGVSKLRRRSVINQQHQQEMSSDELSMTTKTEEPGEILEADERSKETKVAPAVYVFAACAALNSCILGYDLGLTSLSVLLVKETLDLSDVQIESYVGIMGIFSIIGAAMVSVGTQHMGRRSAFLVASVGFILGDVIQGTAHSYETLMLGRSILGVSVGYGLAIDPIYISEIAPKHKRGELVSWSEIAINVGVIFGFASGILFYHIPDEVAWRYMFGTGAILPFTMLVLVKFVMPESPRWLIQQGREEEAKHVLAKLSPGDRDGSEVETIVKTIKESLEEEEARHEFGWVFLVFRPSPAYRRMLWTGVLAGISQQVVGIDGIGSFLAYTLDRSGIHDRFWQALTLIGLQTIKTIITIGAAKQVDRVGRRILCFISLAGMTVSLLTLSADFALSTGTSFVTVLGLLGYLSFFGVGMGPCAWLIPSEVFTTPVRSKGMSLATLSNRLVATTWATSFLSLEKAISWSGVFLVLSALCIVMMAMIYIYVPETKGKSLEEMAVFFATITGDRTVLDGAEGNMGKGARDSSAASKESSDGQPWHANVDQSIEIRTIV